MLRWIELSSICGFMNSVCIFWIHCMVKPNQCYGSIIPIVAAVIFLSFRTDRSGQTVCNSLCIFWMHYSKENPFCSTFRVITANFWVSEILGSLRYIQNSWTQPSGWSSEKYQRTCKLARWCPWIFKWLVVSIFPLLVPPFFFVSSHTTVAYYWMRVGIESHGWETSSVVPIICVHVTNVSLLLELN